jgi:hypothetical protein
VLSQVDEFRCEMGEGTSLPIVVDLPWPHNLPTTGAFVYFISDARGAMLYIGVTENLRNRMRTHHRKYGDADMHAVRFPGIEQAVAYETRSIWELRPRDNRAVDRWHWWESDGRLRCQRIGGYCKGRCFT